ncbi:MAG TPA: FG-GAP-like repeat-containing protein [Rubricoccaceae bacterium]
MRTVLLLFLAAGAAHAQPFVREAAPFPVRDAAGGAVAFPFAGGFFEPRPSFADLDGDGDADLVLNVGGAGLQLFEKTPAGYVWRTDRLGDIEPGNWSAFGDLDRDGDLDLVTRGEPGRVRAYRNTGTAAAPVFTRVSDLLVDTAGEPVAIEDSSIPDLADADGDGDLDLLAGKADLGTVSLYRNDGADAAGAPRFTFVTATFEDISVYEPNPQCGGRPAPGTFAPVVPGSGPAAPVLSETLRRHGANALRLVDLTADGRPELIWGDFFAPSLYFFANSGTPADPAFSLVSDRYPVGQPLTSGGYNASDFGDADGDGDLDLVVGVQRGLCFDPRSAVDNLLYYENAGTAATPDFQRRSDRLLGSVDVGSRAVPALADLDGDGDPDLLVGSETGLDVSGRARLAFYRNIGTATAPDFELADADYLSLAYDYGGYGPVAGDLDGDGDLDLLVGGFNGRFALLRNAGTATAPAFALDAETAGARGFGGVDAGQYARGALGDLDGDGDLDLVTGASSGRVRVHRNVGTPQAASFLVEANGSPQAPDVAFALAAGIPDVVGQDSAPALADLDGDGDLDLLVGTATGAVLTFRNTGTRTAPAFTAEAPLVAGRRRTAPALADADGDGDLDLFAGTDAGGVLFWRRSGGTSSTEAPGGRTDGLRLDVRPNPSSGASRFVASADVQGEAVVFDVRGREVRRVHFTGREAEWDGRDTAGRAVPAGVYVVRLRAGRREATARFTRVG